MVLGMLFISGVSGWWGFYSPIFMQQPILPNRQPLNSLPGITPTVPIMYFSGSLKQIGVRGRYYHYPLSSVPFPLSPPIRPPLLSILFSTFNLFNPSVSSFHSTCKFHSKTPIPISYLLFLPVLLPYCPPNVDIPTYPTFARRYPVQY